MRERWVIDSEFLPVRMPLSLTLLVFILLREFNAPIWLWSIAVFSLFCVWYCILMIKFEERYFGPNLPWIDRDETNKTQPFKPRR